MKVPHCHFLVISTVFSLVGFSENLKSSFPADSLSHWMLQSPFFLFHLFLPGVQNDNLSHCSFPPLYLYDISFIQMSSRGNHKAGSLTPPSSPKAAPKSGHRRILSDVTHSAVFGVPVSKSTQLLQAAAAEASLNKSK